MRFIEGDFEVREDPSKTPLRGKSLARHEMGFLISSTGSPLGKPHKVEIHSGRLN